MIFLIFALFVSGQVYVAETQWCELEDKSCYVEGFKEVGNQLEKDFNWVKEQL